MNKLTKVGLTALAGSLAVVAGANAGSLSVSGGSDITWLSKTGNTTSATDAITGNPIGWKNNITFGASGELDNGISWSANAYNSDAQALTSSNITFDLGGMGALLIDNGAGGAGWERLLPGRARSAPRRPGGAAGRAAPGPLLQRPARAEQRDTRPRDRAPFRARARPRTSRRR